MEFLNKIRDWVQDLEEKDFFKYLGIMLVVLVVIISFLMYRYYRKIGSLQERIIDTNEIREEKVKEILTKHEIVKKRKAKVDAIIAKKEDFNILEVFEASLKKLNIEWTKREETSKDLPELEKYIESELNASIEGIKMDKLCRLLQEFEKNERIYTKELHIKKSDPKKTPEAIDVSLTIATLLPKAETT